MASSLIQTSFLGGISSDSKSGLGNSGRMMRFVDPYFDSDSLTLHPRAVKDSTTVVVDLVRWIVDGHPYSTKLFAYGDAGHIYSETAGTWANLRTVANSQGNGLAVLGRALYYASDENLGRYQYIDGTPAFDDDFIENGIDNLDQSNDDTGQSYTLGTSIDEGATHRQTFTPTKDPLKTIQILVATVGTGNWTVTVHDSANTVIGTATIANGSMSTGDVDFTFSTPLRVTIGEEYHFHVTSTVGDGTVTTGTNADLEDVDFHTYFGILIADYYHPMIIHTDGTRGMVAIGNENYIATFTTAGGISYSPNKIQIEPGYTIRGWAKEDEYIVALCWKGTDLAGSEEGRRFYWDGISPYYNFSKPIMGGMDNAAINYKNRTFSINGHTGELNLSTSQSSLNKIQSIPQLGRGKKVEVEPGAICIWQDRVHFGVGNTDDTTGVELGVYEYGNDSDRATSNESVSTEALNYAYKISTGTNQSSTLEIGALFARGTSMYVSWKDNTTYGVDKITQGGSPSTTGSWESLIIDVGASGDEAKSMPQKEKVAEELIITFEALPEGCTVTPKYKIDRGSWVTGTAGTEGDTEIKLAINKRYKEIEVGFDIVATTNYPVITSIVFLFDPVAGEEPR